MSLLDSSIVAASVGAAACALGNFAAVGSVVRIPRLDAQAPALPEGHTGTWPLLSVVVPACNEGKSIEAAARSLLANDYPALELVLVDDRSSDETGAVIDRLAAEDPRVRALHVTELPPDWLGKVHALHVGTQAARGELLLYADADVNFAPEALRRAVGWVERDRLDHLSLMPRMICPGTWLGGAVSAFATGFLLGVPVHRIGKPGSQAYGGVGAFNLVRRAALDRTEGWPWLRMEIADDAGLGMLLVQKGGGRSRIGLGAPLVEVVWYESLGALIRGLEKNLYGIVAAYSPLRALAALVGIVSLGLSGWVALGLGLAFDRPLPVALAGFAWLSQLVVALVYRRVFAAPVGATLLAPFMLFALAWALLRSAVIGQRSGGLAWRGTLYSLEALRAGRRVDL